MAHQWGELSYLDDSIVQSHPIYIVSISQPQSLSGSTAQSANYRHFYPRSHLPGDIEVQGFCKSQDEYQQLALFIRQHQRALLNTPNDVRYQFPNSQDSQRLLLLDVPTEQTHWRGFVKTFGMVKKGVFVPAPTYTFNLVVVFDSTSENFALSNRVNQYYKSGTRSSTPSTPSTAKVPQ